MSTPPVDLARWNLETAFHKIAPARPLTAN